MPVNDRWKFQHLLWRAGFGPELLHINQAIPGNPGNWYKQLTTNHSSEIQPFDVIDPYLKAYGQGKANQMSTDSERRMIRSMNRDNIKKLNLVWLNEMVHSKNQLNEKMSLFWHGHFACRSQNVFHQQLLLNTIRKHALGNFRELLRAVSKSAAMLNFLNNNQNRKGHPNENFAREVMELFTLGRGEYSEADVKEAARAFTGWGADRQGEFVFRKGIHDDGPKSFLRRTGNFDGDQVLDILLEQKQTAKFITKKIYRFFINEEVDPKRLEWLADRFFKSNYSISHLMKDIFTSDFFYEEKNIGTHIKSPVELLVGIRRTVPLEFQNEQVQLLIQRLLGQLLLYPPNVAGWPGGSNWIDSSSLMFRLQIPQLISQAGQIDIKPKDDDDQMMGMMERPAPGKGNGGGKRAFAAGNQLKGSVNWDLYTHAFTAIPRERLQETISAFLLQVPPGKKTKVIQTHSDSSGRSEYIRSVTTQLMSTPEYQLC